MRHYQNLGNSPTFHFFMHVLASGRADELINAAYDAAQNSEGQEISELIWDVRDELAKLLQEYLKSEFDQWREGTGIEDFDTITTGHHFTNGPGTDGMDLWGALLNEQLCRIECNAVAVALLVDRNKWTETEIPRIEHDADEPAESDDAGESWKNGPPDETE